MIKPRRSSGEELTAAPEVVGYMESSILRLMNAYLCREESGLFDLVQQAAAGDGDVKTVYKVE